MLRSQTGSTCCLWLSLWTHDTGCWSKQRHVLSFFLPRGSARQWDSPFIPRSPTCPLWFNTNNMACPSAGTREVRDGPASSLLPAVNHKQQPFLWAVTCTCQHASTLHRCAVTGSPRLNLSLLILHRRSFYPPPCVSYSDCCLNVWWYIGRQRVMALCWVMDGLCRVSQGTHWTSGGKKWQVLMCPLSRQRPSNALDGSALLYCIMIMS